MRCSNTNRRVHMVSKSITDRQKHTLLILAASQEHGPRILGSIEGEFAAMLIGKERRPDIGLFLQLGERRLEGSTAEMIAADAAHERETADDDVPRQRR